MATGRRRIGPVDTIWLNMDRPNNLMVIVALMFLESVPDWDEVVGVIRKGIVDQYPVFSQRPAAALLPVGLPSWEDDPDFDLERHLHRATLPAPGDDAVLQRYVEDCVPQPLDRRHPLWEVHLVEGYGKGSVVFCRFHHALADGIALTRVLLSMTEDVRGRPTDVDVVSRSTAHAGRVEQATDLVTAGFSLVREGVTQAARLGTPGGLVGAAALTLRATRVVSDLLLVHNPDNPLAGTPGVRKRVVWSRPAPLADLKQTGRLAGATLNDVLLSAVAGALHTYQLGRGAEPVDLVTMVPVNIRPLDQPLPRELGNEFALVFLRFPSATASPLARLAETKRRMDWLKASPEAVLTFGLITAIGRTSREVERHIVDFFANKAIGVTTNVAGPTTPRSFAGVPMTGVLGWVPGSGRHTLGVCIFTYAGKVQLGFMADEGVIPDPEELVRAFEEEIRGLRRVGAGGTTRRRVRHADRQRQR